MKQIYIWILFILTFIPISIGKANYDTDMYVNKYEYEKLLVELDKTQQALNNIISIIEYSKPAVRVSMNKQLIFALAEYEGPKFILSSNYRTWNKRSDHYRGAAIDISTRLNFDLIVKYLSSKPGKKWLNKFGLDYIIENHLKYRNHGKYKYNSRATGPHIHLYIRKYCKSFQGLGHRERISI